MYFQSNCKCLRKNVIPFLIFYFNATFCDLFILAIPVLNML